jgi:hypothetical protein
MPSDSIDKEFYWEYNMTNKSHDQSDTFYSEEELL